MEEEQIIKIQIFWNLQLEEKNVKIAENLNT
jgi:hypothetical protein